MNDEKQADCVRLAMSGKAVCGTGNLSACWIAAITLAAVFGLATWQSDFIRGSIHRLAGAPPPVKLQETHQARPIGPAFDHSVFQQVITKHVQPGGWVDYAGLKRDSRQLDEYIASLGTAPIDNLDRNERLALLINAYNAFTLKLIAEKYPLDSIKDIPARKRWDAVRWQIGPHTWSLNQIEHEQIRPHFNEPRIHFALVCAAVGCPPLASEVYQGEGIEKQLAKQTAYVHDHGTWLQVDRAAGKVKLTKLYQWYADDFAQNAGSVIKFVSNQSDEVAALTQNGNHPGVSYLDYDWKLNSVENKRNR